jgi:alkyl hydroperoxide reductase subunit AhpC
MFGFTRYNYDRFRREMLQGYPGDRWSRAPEPGDEAPGFELRSLSGNMVKLSDFKNSRNVVVTFGSATCPQTAASIGGLRSLAREFPRSEVEFLFIYVREAHPGAELPPHHSMEDKAHAAILLRDQEQIEFPVLVDELGGEVHRKYGALPNASFIVDKSGRIAYRSLASHGASLGAAIEELIERQKERGVHHAIVHGGEDDITPSLKTFLNAYRAIERGGYDAVVNFRGELGIPGRALLRGGRMARPMTEHPVITIASAVGVVAAIGLGIWAGYELRKRRFNRRPYDAYRKFTKRGGSDDDYTAVGI